MSDITFSRGFNLGLEGPDARSTLRRQLIAAFAAAVVIGAGFAISAPSWEFAPHNEAAWAGSIATQWLAPAAPAPARSSLARRSHVELP